jgi:HEAT repeat protein
MVYLIFFLTLISCVCLFPLDLKCSTKYAYQRIVGLFCVAINKEDDKDVQSQLCKELCRLLGLSGNLKLVAECRQALPLDKLTETFSAIANDSGIPAMSLAPSDWQIFVKHALGDTVASAMEMEMCEPMLKSIPFSDWEETVAPALILKLKSQPETASEMAEGLTKCINPDVIVQSKVVVDDLLPVLTKNAKSPKENIRQVSASILLNLASATIRASNQEDAKKCLEAIVTALADTKSLAQAYQRETVYTILKTIAATITKETAVDTKVISKVLQGVCTPLAKETKAATQAREEGLEALLRWMVVAKRNGGSTGYDEALTFVRAPVIAKNGADSLIMLGTLVQLLHPDLVESLVFDLWSDSKFVIGLEALVEAANKKHDSKSAAPPAEGLIAVYLSLVQASASSSKKLSDTFDKALSAGSAVTSKTSFVYGKAVTDSVTTHPLVSQILPRIIVMYAKLNAKSIVAFNDKPSAAVTKAMACSIAHPTISVGQSPTQAIESAAQTLLDYQPAADALVEALFAHVNRLSLDAQEVADSLNATRQARERDDNTSIKGKGSPTGYHSGMDINSIRRVARKLAARSTTPKGLAMALVLMHTGSSLRTNGKQRTSLVHYTTEVLKDIVLPQWKNMQSFLTAVADLVAEHASFAKLPAEEDSSISETLHLGALSLVTSLGGIGSNFEPANDDPEDVEMRPFVFAYKLCTKEIATRLAENVKTVISKLEALTENQIDVYKTPVGTLYRGDARSSSGTEKKARGKGRLSEDEQWELQMQEELAKKQEAPSGSLSADEKKLLHAQDADRQRMSTILKGDFVRMMAAVENLALSDIEIGNVCLPLVSEGVLTVAVSDCPATKSLPILKAKSLATLTTLATCVYEIQEEFASMMATALVVSCQYKIDPDDPLAKKSNSSEGLDISALPSPCEPAASTIFEMDEFQDELSGPSFAFLFPVVRAALMGPRTTPGCEGALRVLERHTKLLAGEEEDSVVVPLRKDMVASVLELLKHDRAQTFVDPTPFDTLVACYQTNEDNPGPALATSELAALLDERGALGSKSCRIAAMLAIGSIASRHPKLVKNNPLIENRIWLNCFENNEDIRKEARNTWGIVHGVAGLAEADRNSPLPPPSPVYAIPLLPLLSNVNESIAAAAAVAYAQGMAAHPKSVNKNIQKICSTYIESVPVAADEGAKSSSPFPTTSISAKIPVAAPKKPIGVPAALRKKTVKTSALAVAGIGGPKKTKKKSPSVNSALLKPKQERTFDHDALASQFQTGPKKAPPEKDSPAKVATRMGVLHAVSALTSTSVEMEMPTLTLLTSFLIAYGIADSDDGVKGISRNALRDIVATYGESDEAIAFLLPHLDHVLKTGLADEDTLGALPADKMPREGAAKDRRKEGAVVALGSVALHLKGPENVGKIDTTIDMLLQSLKTPSDDVQSSVADCLAKLMKKGNTQERIEAILDDLMKDCLDSDSAAVRRGAGYGISAAVKGSGIATLKKFGIVTKLEESCSNGSSSSKEGSLFAIELLCKRLGLLFEPYVIVLLPSLLRSFSDTSDRVREAASNTVGLIMSKLSAHGVKLVMPAVLTAFEDKSWRTKQASIHMLGSMSHLAPKQLASALPKVVPKLTEAFADTHPKVKESAQKALDEISTVIKNPEISSIASTLLKALTDPANSTILALEELIQTEFLHAIDAPSLALIVPILHRGLRDRAAITKRYGALIAGNICTMINDPRDFVPYIPTLIPDLKTILLDPIPDVRSIAAKALGSLTRGLGEDALPDLRPWLVERLRAEGGSSAERSGAAQGLTEVLIASGTSVVESVMLDDILPLKSHPSPSTREGVLWVLTFLPPALGHGFTPLLDLSLPALISGLSDDNEQVREVAMRAGRVMIKSHGRGHVDTFLPILEGGMGDEDYRIRVSSLMLLGDLLSMIAGTTVLKTDGDTQEDIRRAERAQAQLTLALGMDTRNRIFSGLYLLRSDSASAVRQGAIQVWKTVVSVTARTLRQILPVLVKMVVADLASGNIEKTEIAGKCLGDIVSKLGDSVLPEIIPVLRNSLTDGDAFTRRGVCVGLSEVITCSTKDQILRFIDIIVKVVQDALCDDDEDVRELAATSFQNLHFLIGNRAMDEVVPALMVALESSSSDETRRVRALNGLTGILGIRSRELLPYIIPRLIERPITLNHARALTGIAAVTGDTIYYHFSTILPALMNDLAAASGDDEEREEAVRECAKALFANVDTAGVNMLMSEIAGKCGSDKVELRRESCLMLESVITERKYGSFSA